MFVAGEAFRKKKDARDKSGSQREGRIIRIGCSATGRFKAEDPPHGQPQGGRKSAMARSS
jgi:hypothetical protein